MLNSVSRLMSGIAKPEHKEAANKLRNMLAVYRDNEDLISIGAYKPGSNPELDLAMAHMKKIDEFLIQRVDDPQTFEKTVALLRESVI